MTETQSILGSGSSRVYPNASFMTRGLLAHLVLFSSGPWVEYDFMGLGRLICIVGLCKDRANLQLIHKTLFTSRDAETMDLD